jgi:hypothetical protein
MHDLLADMATGARGKFGTQGMPVIERVRPSEPGNG